MTHDFDEDLRQALHRHAATTPRRPDLARAAIGRARTIQRRRRVTGVVAAAALIALAVPLGIQAGDLASRSSEQPEIADTPGPDDEAPAEQVEVELDLGDLPVGSAPAVPYLDGTTLVFDGEELDVGETPNSFNAALGSDGIVYYVSRVQGRPSELQRFSPTEGALSSLGTVESGPWASADGRYVLWGQRAAGSREVVALDTETGQEYALPVDAGPGRVPLGVADGTAYLWSGEQVETWRFGEESASIDPAVQDAFVFSPAGTLRSDDTPGEGETGRCSTVVDQSTGEQLWDTCEHTVGGFTSDDRYAWGYSSDRVSISRGYNVVLHAASGDEVLRIEPGRRGDIFGNRLETDDTLLVLYSQGGQVAVVRCTISTGACELATEPVDGDAYSFPNPYVLEAVAGLGSS